MNKKFNLIIPVAAKDISTILISIPYIKMHIKANKYVIISSISVREQIIKFGDSSVVFLDEDSVIDTLTFKKLYDYLTEKRCEKRTGWYFQQFIKMGYCSKSETEFYLSWDADTVPIRNIEMFNGINDESKPIFSIKKEFNKPYFNTIKTLFGINKCTNGSFIAEHMLFKKEYMNEIINKLDSEDKPWYFKIIDSINTEDLSRSGFSEFETYGTYTICFHGGSYVMKRYWSVRDGTSIFGTIPCQKVLNWLSKYYSAISFEKGGKKLLKNDIYNNCVFRIFVPANIYILFTKIYFKIKIFKQQTGNNEKKNYFYIY